jgi:hypothetical protein
MGDKKWFVMAAEHTGLFTAIGIMDFGSTRNEALVNSLGPSGTSDEIKYLAVCCEIESEVNRRRIKNWMERIGIVQLYNDDFVEWINQAINISCRTNSVRYI